ncbi:hypothetical protein [Xanthomonas pisi]|uniref:hypothetical protein n=1 Tax=Xanthomonas pisi TaxID=56457 RepID=UPI0012EE349B|nr:hypothetical protein [Xanthomonas pisi]
MRHVVALPPTISKLADATNANADSAGRMPVGSVPFKAHSHHGALKEFFNRLKVL